MLPSTRETRSSFKSKPIIGLVAALNTPITEAVGKKQSAKKRVAPFKYKTRAVSKSLAMGSAPVGLASPVNGFRVTGQSTSAALRESSLELPPTQTARLRRIN